MKAQRWMTHPEGKHKRYSDDGGEYRKKKINRSPVKPHLVNKLVSRIRPKITTAWNIDKSIMIMVHGRKDLSLSHAGLCGNIT